MPSFRIISIGTLAAHPLWEERGEVRTGHATTTLVEAGDVRLIVNPGLPAAALGARLSERSPLRPEQITHVFMTCFQPDHRRSLGLFESAQWLLHEPERAAAEATLHHRKLQAEEVDDEQTATIFARDLGVLRRIAVAPDRIAPGIDLFPLPGVTPGTCGLLLPLPRRTVLITGDAIPTSEHLEQGKVLQGSLDLAAAQESFKEAVEIADILIPGRDNIAINPLR